MRLSRTDVGALAAVAVSGAIGVALFGPRMWSGDSVVTVDVRSEWTTESVTSADGEATVVIDRRKTVREDASSSEQGENVFVLRTSDGPEPLVYIDGERVERSAMEELDPDRIDRVEVLKGQAAEGLYGPDAVGGVVQIFTKDGSGSN